jgi:hypothetical protein
MIKSLFSFLILTLSISAYSQSYLSPLFGASSSYNSGIGSFAESPNIGYNLGVEIGDDLGKRFGVAFDLQFAQKSFSQKIYNDDYLKYNFNYVIPSLFIKYTFLETKNCKYNLKTGPFLGFWMSGNSVLNFNNKETRSTLAFSDRYSKLNYGINASFSADIKRFSIESRVCIGFMDMEFVNNKSSKLNSLELLVGYKIMK